LGPCLCFQFHDHFTDGRTPWTSDQLIARPLPKHRTTQTQNKHTHTPNIHALCGIRTHDPGFRAREDSSCLRSLGYRDLHSTKTLPSKSCILLAVLLPNIILNYVSETPTSEFCASARLLLWSQKATGYEVGVTLNDINISTRFCGSRSSVEKEDILRWLDGLLSNSFSYRSRQDALRSCVLHTYNFWATWSVSLCLIRMFLYFWWSYENYIFQFLIISNNNSGSMIYEVSLVLTCLLQSPDVIYYCNLRKSEFLLLQFKSTSYLS
jgi:hypothetical protein